MLTAKTKRKKGNYEMLVFWTIVINVYIYSNTILCALNTDNKNTYIQVLKIKKSQDSPS